MPIFVFGILIATLMAAVTHLLVGGPVRRLLALIVCAWAGFAFGHVLGVAFRWDALNVGMLRLLPAALSAAVMLAAAAALSAERGKRLKRLG